jgi:5,10-methylenetetrahydromethanopterin reductase
MKRTGFGVWTNMPIGDALISVREAEKHGFESAWVVESSLTPGKDAISYLGALAVSTNRIRLATGVINIFSRSATLIASTMATLDEISSGRMILGIGTGHLVIGPYHSVEFRDPLNRMREYLAVFNQLVAGNSVNYEGSYLHVKNLKLNMQPVRKKIPAYVATVGEGLAKVAGEIADGLIFVMTSPARVRELVKAAEEGARKAGGSLDDIDIACYLPAFIMADSEKAMKGARQNVAGYGRSVFYRRLYRKMAFKKEADNIKEAWARGGMEEAIAQVPEPMAKELVLVGSPEDCLKRVEDYRRAGVKLPLIQPFYTPGDLDSNVKPCVDLFGT